jgi:hypothetical protein
MSLVTLSCLGQNIRSLRFKFKPFVTASLILTNITYSQGGSERSKEYADICDQERQRYAEARVRHSFSRCASCAYRPYRIPSKFNNRSVSSHLEHTQYITYRRNMDCVESLVHMSVIETADICSSATKANEKIGFVQHVARRAKHLSNPFSYPDWTRVVSRGFPPHHRCVT